MCAQGFENADNLLSAVEELIRMLQKKWYKEVNAEKIAAIKAVMVSGSEGIATHFKHWYNCMNDHSVGLWTHHVSVLLLFCVNWVTVYDQWMRHVYEASLLLKMWGFCWWTESCDCQQSHTCNKHESLKIAKNFKEASSFKQSNNWRCSKQKLTELNLSSYYRTLSTMW